MTQILSKECKISRSRFSLVMKAFSKSLYLKMVLLNLFHSWCSANGKSKLLLLTLSLSYMSANQQLIT